MKQKYKQGSGRGQRDVVINW